MQNNSNWIGFHLQHISWSLKCTMHSWLVVFLIFWILYVRKKTAHGIHLRCLWIDVVKRLNPPFINLWYSAPCCFLRALSHIAGLMETGFPFLCIHLFEQTRTPKHDFFKILTLWLLVFRIAHPDVCFLASSELGEYT